MTTNELMETCVEIDRLMKQIPQAKTYHAKNACYELADSLAKKIVEAGLEDRNYA